MININLILEKTIKQIYIQIILTTPEYIHNPILFEQLLKYCNELKYESDQIKHERG